jgi:methyl-accepting chemotaxis protein
MKNTRLSTKMYFSFGVILLLLSLVGAGGLWSVNQMGAAADQYSWSQEGILFLTQKESDHLKWVNKVRDLFISKTSRLEVELDPTKCSLGRFLHGPDAKQLASHDARLGTLLENINEPHNKLHRSGEHLAAVWNPEKPEAALQVFRSEVLPALVQSQHAITEAIGRLNELKDAAKHSLLTTSRTARWATTIVSLVALALGIVLAVLLTGYLMRSIKTVVDTLRSGSDELAAASSQVASASQSLAEGSSQQAAALEETSSSLEEITSIAQQNSDNAQQANDLMEETRRVVTDANQSMQSLKEAMETITQASDETGKVIKTIDEIAFQTNLLALNAAVEAARAGEAGAGFAVVADEVRNLAMRAAEAAKVTAQLIEGNIENIRRGSQLVAATDQSFSKVEDSAARVASLVEEISAASQEQALGVEQINSATVEMDNVTQQVASNAQESAASSEELSSQAGSLRDTVGYLSRIVYGERGADRSAGGHRKGFKQGGGDSFGGRRLLPYPKKAASPAPKRSAAAQAIPFGDDDEDFADF